MMSKTSSPLLFRYYADLGAMRIPQCHAVVMKVKGCAKKKQTLDFFAHKLRSFQYFFMKIDMDALNCNTKLILNWF